VRHFRIALYDVTSGTAQEVIEIARDRVIPLFEQQPGFVRYEVGALDTGGIVSFSVWETEAEARHAEEVAAEFNKENLADRMKLREEHTGDLAWDEAL
jgi:heme-degrading monooxygenase HmoA